jgi:hypothetical protein
MLRYPTQTKRQGFDLFFLEHQRWQQKARTQNIANTGFAAYFSALPLKGGDVAIQATQADAEFGRQRRPTDRPPMLPQEL